MNTNKIYSMLVLLLLCVAMQTSVVASQEIQVSDMMEKVYVHPSQLYIIEEGIFFVNSEGNLERAGGVFCDTGGIYVARWYKCRNCKYANDDGICINRNCPLFGQDAR